MSPSTDLTARETEIIRILRIMGQATSGFVVLGGYAVSALGQHRFSVDCDLATDVKHVQVLDATLNRDGYARIKSRPRLPEGVATREYVKRVGEEPSTVELFVNRVVSRATQGTWTYGFIRENSVEALVVGVTDSTPSHVVGRDLLVAMKLHAGRRQDLGDIVVLSRGVDWETVSKLAACGSKEKLTEQLESAINEISSLKFTSDLKSTFAMRGNMESLISTASRGLEKLKTLIARQNFSSVC